MKRIFITLFLGVATLQLFCQVDNIEQQILNYDDSKSVIISKGRSLLLDKFLENDIEKVREIKNYLIEKGEDEDYVALYRDEYWLILYWTKEYEQLLNSVKSYSPNSYDEYRSYSYSWRGYRGWDDKRIYPMRDVLFDKLLQSSIENEFEIINQIKSADIDLEEKRFLQLNFASLIKKRESYIDTLNLQAESFKETYPSSEYNDYIRYFIKHKVETFAK
jgi:hypothetical protein